MAEKVREEDSSSQNANLQFSEPCTVAAIDKISRHSSKSRITFIDGKTVAVMDDVIALFALHREMILQQSEIQDIIQKSQRIEATQKALLYVSQRLHSTHEIRQKLLKKGFSTDATAYSIERLAQLSYLDDRAFTEAFVRSKMKTRVSKKALSIELRRKGISREMALEVVERIYTQEQEYDNLINLIDKLSRDNKESSQKIIRKLSARGFGGNLIYRAMKQRGQE